MRRGYPGGGNRDAGLEARTDWSKVVHQHYYRRMIYEFFFSFFFFPKESSISGRLIRDPYRFGNSSREN